MAVNKPKVARENNRADIQKDVIVSHENLSITSIADLEKYAGGTVVRFPDFEEGKPFVARVKRPSMLVLAKQGKIPNALLNTASDMFSGKPNGNESAEQNEKQKLNDMYGVMEVVCEACLMEPTLQDITNAGLTLSDEQMIAIFNYTQVGVKALTSFRK